MDLPEVVKEKLIELDAENRQLKLDVARKDAALKNRDEMCAELEEENRKLHLSASSSRGSAADVTRLEGQLAALRSQLEEKSTTLHDVSSKLEKAEQARLEAEKELREMSRPCPDVSVYTEPPPPQIDEEELIRLRDEKDDALMEIVTLKVKLASVTQENEECKEELESVHHMLADRGNTIKELRDEKSTLESEMMELKCVPGASRGNSVFSEFVDERAGLERDLKQLFAECEALKAENYRLSNELDEARLRAIRRAGNGGYARCECSDQKPELARLRANLEEANKRCSNLRNEFLQSGEKARGPGIDPVLRSRFVSLRMEFERVEGLLVSVNKQRDSLHDENLSLTAQLSRSENQLKFFEDEVRVLKLQLESRKEKERTATTSKTCSSGQPGSATKTVPPVQKLLQPFNHVVPCTPQPKTIQKSTTKRVASTPIATTPFTNSYLAKQAKKEEEMLRSGQQPRGILSKAERRQLEGRDKPMRAVPRAHNRQLPVFKPVVMDFAASSTEKSSGDVTSQATVENQEHQPLIPLETSDEDLQTSIAPEDLSNTSKMDTTDNLGVLTERSCENTSLSDSSITRT